MTTYTGPIPPAPTATSSAAEWQNWWAFKNLEASLRYEDERAARSVITDKQHAEKMVAEAACAAATKLHADAIQAQAAAMRYAIDNPLPATPDPAPTDEQLTRYWMQGLAEAGISGVAALSAAKASLRAFRLLYPAKA